MLYEDAPDDKYTWEGFQAWALREPVERPEAPTRPQLEAMSELERARFELARSAWHAEMTVATPDYRRVHRELENLMRSNVHAPSPRPGATINGSSGQLGKSWAAERFAAKFERRIREDAGEAVRLGTANPPPSKWVPTVLTTLSGNSTTASCSKQILNFFGAPHPESRRDDGALTRIDDYIDAIAHVVHRCGSRLLIVDDIHHLQMHRKDHKDVSSFFKVITQRTPLTCVLVGIGVTDFLNEGEGVHRQQMSQWRGRTTPLHLRPYVLGEQRPADEEQAGVRDDSDDWLTLLRNVESKLVLCALRPGALSSHPQMLHRRTAGTVGVLMKLVRAVVADAIRTGSEDLDADALRTRPIPELNPGDPGWAADDEDAQAS